MALSNLCEQGLANFLATWVEELRVYKDSLTPSLARKSREFEAQSDLIIRYIRNQHQLDKNELGLVTDMLFR